MTKQNRIVNIGITGKFGEKKSQDFKLNEKLLQQEKRKRLTVVPRWHSPAVFKETTLRNSLDFLKRRSSRNRKRDADFNRSKRKLGGLLKSRTTF